MQTESSTDQATAPPPSVPGGTVSAVRGSVLDVVFAQGATPAINDALRTAGAAPVVAEVQAYLDERTVRAVAMQPTEGLSRGAPVEVLGGPITVPVGEAVLGRLLDVLGNAQDAAGPVDPAAPRRQAPAEAGERRQCLTARPLVSCSSSRTW